MIHICSLWFCWRLYRCLGLSKWFGDRLEIDVPCTVHTFINIALIVFLSSHYWYILWVYVMWWDISWNRIQRNFLFHSISCTLGIHSIYLEWVCLLFFLLEKIWRKQNPDSCNFMNIFFTGMLFSIHHVCMFAVFSEYIFSIWNGWFKKITFNENELK